MQPNPEDVKLELYEVIKTSMAMYFMILMSALLILVGVVLNSEGLFIGLQTLGVVSLFGIFAVKIVLHKNPTNIYLTEDRIVFMYQTIFSGEIYKSYNIIELKEVLKKTIFPFDTGIQFKFSDKKVNILLNICNKYGASPAMLVKVGPESLIQKIEELRNPSIEQHKSNFVTPSAYRYTDPILEYLKGEVLTSS